MSREEEKEDVPPPIERQESRIVKLVKDPSVMKYLVQAGFGMIVLIFSAAQIVINPDDSNQLWVGLICTVVGIFFPHPSPHVMNIYDDIHGIE